MENKFNGDEAIFDEFKKIPGFNLAGQVSLINKSQVLIDLLHNYAEKWDGKLTYNDTEDKNGYNRSQEEPSIQFHDISGNDFTRILGHELGHAYDHLERKELTIKGSE